MPYDGINKIRIFLDTNIIEARHEESCLTLNTIRLNSDFYKLLDFCKDITEIQVCIPTVVWKEVCIHLVTCFRSTMDQMNTKFRLYQKTFGDLIELSLDTKGYNPEKYSQYVQKISDEFWRSVEGQCYLVDFEMTTTAFNGFVDKAVKAVRPFVQAKSKAEANKKSKDYSDAGFKDAIIAETIFTSCNEDEIGILFTDDTDFNDVFQNYDRGKYIALKTLDQVKDQINTILKRNDVKVVKALFENNAYTQESLFNLIGVDYDKSITDLVVLSVEKDEDIYILNIAAHVNEVEYNLLVKYDIVANEIIDVRPTLKND